MGASPAAFLIRDSKPPQPVTHKTVSRDLAIRTEQTGTFVLSLSELLRTVEPGDLTHCPRERPDLSDQDGEVEAQAARSDGKDYSLHNSIIQMKPFIWALHRHPSFEITATGTAKIQ
jgi:hypothetical protein